MCSLLIFAFVNVVFNITFPTTSLFLSSLVIHVKKTSVSYKNIRIIPAEKTCQSEVKKRLYIYIYILLVIMLSYI
jgi:hypothetical protein